MNGEICIERQKKIENLSSCRFGPGMVHGDDICDDSCTVTETKNEANRGEIMNLARNDIFY